MAHVNATCENFMVGTMALYLSGIIFFKLHILFMKKKN